MKFKFTKMNFKNGDIVRILSHGIIHNGIVKKIGSKFIYVETVGSKSVTEKFDKMSRTSETGSIIIK